MKSLGSLSKASVRLCAQAQGLGGGFRAPHSRNHFRKKYPDYLGSLFSCLGSPVTCISSKTETTLSPLPSNQLLLCL